MKNLYKKIKYSNLLTYANFINANIVIYLIVFVKSVLARKFVSPTEYGEFIQTQLLLSYGAYLQLGTHNALNFEIPGLIVKNEKDKLKLVIGSVMGYSLLISILSIATIPFIFSMNLSKQLAFGYTLTAITLSSTFFLEGIQNIYRGYQNYKKLSKVLFIKSIIDLTCTLIFTYMYGYYGLFIGSLISSVVMLLMVFPDILKIKLSMSFSIIFERIKIGFPIFFNGMLWSLLMTLSQSLAVLKLTHAQIGIFSIALIAFACIMIVPSTISQIIYPKILGICSQEDATIKLRQMYIKFMKQYIPVITLITGFAMLLIPIALKLFLPLYSEGITSAKIIIISLLFLAPNSINVNVLVAMGKTKRITINLIFSAIFMIITELNLIDFFGIDGITLSLVFTFALYSLLNMKIIIKQLSIKLTKNIYSSLFYFIIPIIPMFLTGNSFEDYITGFLYIVLLVSIFVIMIIRLYKTKDGEMIEQ